MRIASLVPSATELLFALGAGDSVVAITHECDHPPEARRLPHLTRSVIPEGLGAAEIDAAVRERTERGEAIYALDAGRLEALEPDLIVTQAVCEVCAVSFDDVVSVASGLPSRPEVISLDPATLANVLADFRRLGRAAAVPERAEALAADARTRLDRVAEAVAGAPRPRVAALEWLDPVFIGGHWVPEMIALAGGADALGDAGRKSRVVEWSEVQAARPDAVVCMPCGYDAERSRREALDHAHALELLAPARIVAVDASAYFSRPGPRLVDGIELLAHVLHPDRAAAPPPGRVLPVEVGEPQRVG